MFLLHHFYLLSIAVHYGDRGRSVIGSSLSDAWVPCQAHRAYIASFPDRTQSTPLQPLLILPEERRSQKHAKIALRLIQPMGGGHVLPEEHRNIRLTILNSMTYTSTTLRSTPNKAPTDYQNAVELHFPLWTSHARLELACPAASEQCIRPNPPSPFS
jgi:hypothetical protein